MCQYMCVWQAGNRMYIYYILFELDEMMKLPSSDAYVPKHVHIYVRMYVHPHKVRMYVGVYVHTYIQ